MELNLYNTATRKKEVFTPLDPKNVRLYVCGPTVYDYAHIGNARPVIVFDVLFRLLRHRYGADCVRYVRNITDVDDKINARAKDEGIDIRVLTDRTARQFHEDIAALGVLQPTVEPRATEHIPQMIAMIGRLIAAGHAYPAEGHVLYDVGSKPDYGKLARRTLDEMIAGARVDVAPYKKNPMDFVLWKPSSPELPGWESPWGRGRPGWHIECSAMSEQHLGETFDIHGGGIDLVFPHHENEIAQSEGAHDGAPLAKIWMHNGFLQVEGEKMSKSAGNFVTINELLTKGWQGSIPYSGDAIRFAMLTTHYRQPIDWTLKRLRVAWHNLDTFMSLGKLRLGLDEYQDLNTVSCIAQGHVSEALLTNLADDLNTPAAINPHLFALADRARKDDEGGRDAARQILVDCRFLGIDPFRALREERAKNLTKIPPSIEIDNWITARNAARKAKNFKEADRIRDELLAQGIVLKDGPDGTTWELKR